MPFGRMLAILLYVYLVVCRHDVVAQICHARSLAEKLKPVARMMKLDGGHLVSHERTKEVLYLNNNWKARYCFFRGQFFWHYYMLAP